MAAVLVRSAERKRRSELESLQRCVNLNVDLGDEGQQQEEEMMVDFPVFEWPSDFDLGFGGFADFLDGIGSEGLEGRDGLN